MDSLPAANLTPRLADDFIRDMRAMSGRNADSTRLVVSACSSFFSFLRAPRSSESSRPRPSQHSPRALRWPSKRVSA